MTADRPRIVDQAAHAERVALDAQIRTLSDQLATAARTARAQDTQDGAKRLLELKARRRDAFRRETGWTGPPSNPLE